MGRNLKLAQYIPLDPPNLLQTVFPVRFDFAPYIFRPRLDHLMREIHKNNIRVGLDLTIKSLPYTAIIGEAKPNTIFHVKFFL